ncbi:hypothetical protein [Acetobacterium sp. K1/6]|jgi:hypothetical protein|uniref:hypothetical protein n=1 Tax=Acetobacterium sp. K1/6 TaxID=3055467 RepID=UPI002ACA86A1|nr:hypothetical protein [Acetobacterium sp. K1/6]MDZ5726651.1 hypothetical protein [Acetobacterium sp. K1/6]
MKNLLVYHFKTYLKSYKLLLPFLIYLIYLFTAYGIMPFSIVSSFSESAGVLFFIMAYVGFSYAELENPITEQLVLLRINNDTLYYLSRLTMLLIIGVVMSIIGILYPLVLNVINNNHLFTRNLQFEDVAIGLSLHCLMAFLGAMTGSFFHPRIIRNRKMAVLLLFFVAVMGISKGALADYFPQTRLIAWVFPPVFDILAAFTGLEFFSLPAMALPVALTIIYGFVLIIGQIELLKRAKF